MHCHLALNTKVKKKKKKDNPKLSNMNNLWRKGKKQSIISWLAHVIPRIGMIRQILWIFQLRVL